MTYVSNMPDRQLAVQMQCRHTSVGRDALPHALHAGAEPGVNCARRRPPRVLVLIIFIVLTARGDGIGYAIVICFVVFVSVVPVRLPSHAPTQGCTDLVQTLVARRATAAFSLSALLPYPLHPC